MVAAALGRFSGAVVLEDASGALPLLDRAAGLETWTVCDPGREHVGVFYGRPEDVPAERRGRVPETIWPPTAVEAAALGLARCAYIRSEPTHGSLTRLASPVPRCLRLLPHKNGADGTGGFFVAVLRKLAPTPAPAVAKVHVAMRHNSPHVDGTESDCCAGSASSPAAAYTARRSGQSRGAYLRAARAGLAGRRAAGGGRRAARTARRAAIGGWARAQQGWTSRRRRGCSASAAPHVAINLEKYVRNLRSKH